MNKLNIPQVYIERIRCVYNIVKQELPHAQIYLFGSYAKRKIKPTSDMDLLILVDYPSDKKEIRIIKWRIEEMIEEVTKFEYEVDLKIYGKTHFNTSKESLGFESEISKYMIEVEEELWR